MIFFNQICVLVLLQDIETKAPYYIEDKCSILKSDWPLAGWGILDREHRERVLAYYNDWRIELPAEVVSYERSFDPSCRRKGTAR